MDSLGKKLTWPTDRTCRRLLEGCEKEPRYLPHLLRFLPETPEAVARVKKLYDPAAASAKPDDAWTTAVRNWLMRHGPYFRDELIRAARNATFKSFGLEGKEELVALARLDWARAEPILKEYAAGAERRRAAEARVILFRQALAAGNAGRASELRRQLQAAVADKKLPSYARGLACEGLLAVAWPGRDECYLSLFADETLRELSENSRLMRPLCGPVESDPDRWIPVLAKLVGNKDRAVHDNAVSCLIQFHLENARKDALAPLLPWLSDPGWSRAQDRLRLLQSLDRIGLPESVPGLIKVVEREDEFALAAAAAALAVYRDRRAGPALKSALQRDNDEKHRREVVAALLACDGLTDDEIVAAVEAYAVKLSTPEGLAEVRAALDAFSFKLPAKVSLGYQLWLLGPLREQAAARLLARADARDKDRPAVALNLRRTVQSWPGKTVDAYFLRRLRDGQADAETLEAVLNRRSSLRANVAAEVQALKDRPGVVGGWAAVLSGDPRQKSAILDGNDAAAQRALLAGARLVREPLPVVKVGRLLKKGSPAVALAAERYLESEDSPAARQLVYARHPGEALILGARHDFDPGHNNYEALDAWEKGLRAEVLGQDGPQEIYALFIAGYGRTGGQVVVRLRRDGAEVSVHVGKEAPDVRQLKPAELAALRASVTADKVDDLPPLNRVAFDGLQYEYLHLTKDGGRRVFMNNPNEDDAAYDRLLGSFSKLMGKGVELPKARFGP
jgi:hypothetical protein